MVVGEIAVETDVVVIGGGPGGYTSAIRLGQLGKSVVLVEKEQLGGVCLHSGCIPSKALIHAAGLYDEARSASKLGLRMEPGALSFNMSDWQLWKSGIVGRLGNGVAHLCAANGVTVVKGSAVFLSDDRVGVETESGFETYKFKQAVIATGSRPHLPAFAAAGGSRILTSMGALESDSIPEHLVIIGSGYIGIELGMAFAKLGCRVTLIEREERILPLVEGSLSAEVKRRAGKLGMVIKMGTEVRAVIEHDDYVELRLESRQQGEESVLCDKVLVTVGRMPNTEGLGLSQAGVRIDERGYVPVDAECRTNVRHIFAIGDITPGPALAHRAARQGTVAAEVIGGLPSAFDSPYVPYVIFSDPQIAGVGLTRAEAERQGMKVKTGRFPFRANGYALAAGKTDGFAEVVIEEDSSLLLGMHAVGADAGSLIGQGVLALEMAARAEDVAMTVHPHPTLSEGWLEAAAAALGHAIHIVNERRLEDE
ncbi:dihydrolipoyl dehydrogenase [Paenibacillus alvei]|uniref:Dihydrolipoyl dehydrogenase n=1 Tax=Paenibacillus alvei TaxID=44250 RepID=A0A383R5Z7_PAEAL|nr:dihydrolipoyl dehydrogenase [Paenibacillus alvei]SYX82370.1 dihydrolipoamide dehydrogenase E3 subunit of both pyruvate dehydrogenase and 2-oxoglutarate dehydrogenase complexes [Paenibacillus alvei]